MIVHIALLLDSRGHIPFAVAPPETMHQTVNSCGYPSAICGFEAKAATNHPNTTHISLLVHTTLHSAA